MAAITEFSPRLLKSFFSKKMSSNFTEMHALEYETSKIQLLQVFIKLLKIDNVSSSIL